MTNAPIFIVGTPRSGTTLTAKIIGRHSHVFMPGETHFFDDIYSRRKELGDPSDIKSRDKIIQRLLTLYSRYNEPSDQVRVDRIFSADSVLMELNRHCGNYRDLFSCFMETQMKQEGKTRWGNNAPRDIFNIPDILAFYPDAKILVCVRDIRDFLSSYQNKWKITADEEVERLKQLYHPVVTTLLWKSSMGFLPSITSQVPKSNSMIVKYEELVHHPEKVLHEICATIEEDYESEMLSVEYNNSSLDTAARGIYSVSVGTWKKKLRKEDVYVGQLLAGEEMRQLGYEVERVKVNKFSLAMIFITFPIALVRALYANRAKRGPITLYLYKRVCGFFSHS